MVVTQAERWFPTPEGKACNEGYSEGQKCWDLPSDISKTGNLLPPTPNKVEVLAKWG